MTEFLLIVLKQQKITIYTRTLTFAVVSSYLFVDFILINHKISEL